MEEITVCIRVASSEPTVDAQPFEISAHDVEVFPGHLTTEEAGQKLVELGMKAGAEFWGVKNLTYTHDATCVKIAAHPTDVTREPLSVVFSVICK